MGALIAYRVACYRRARGEVLPRALLLSAYPAPHLAAPLPLLDHGDGSGLAALLSGIGGLPPELRDWPGGVDGLLAVARDDLRLCAGHRDLGEEPLACRMHLFGSDADSVVTEHDLRAWERHASEPVELQILSGDHFYIRDEPEQLLAHLRPLLRRYL
jgi:surfactin synthase thioesterase subunit